MAATKPMTISLPANLLRETERLASAEAKTTTKLIEDALRQYVTSRRWQYLRQLGTETAKRLGLKTEADLERWLVHGHVPSRARRR